MSQTIHIFKKDVRRLSWEIVLSLLLLALYGWCQPASWESPEVFLMKHGQSGNFRYMGSMLLGPLLVLTPFAGASVIVKAFAIVIIGGFGNIEGTIIAGLLVGLIESFTTQYLDPGLIDIVVFALLLLTLAMRPTGLVAERREENV